MLNCIRLCLILIAVNAHAFGVDVCFYVSDSGEPIIRNCIDAKEVCRTSRLSLAHELTCRMEAVNDALSTLAGESSRIGGRSLLHADATYFMAQMLGFSAWQAYQIMAYSEATDQSPYMPFDQKGKKLLTDETLEQCREHWGPNMPSQCLILTPELNGLSKFNYATGGMQLHLHARFSPNGTLPPALAYPIDYLSPKNSAYEAVLTNFRAWVFNQRKDACVAGITQHMVINSSDQASCERANYTLESPMNFFELGFSKLAMPLFTQLGTLVIHVHEQAGVLRKVFATNDSFQRYITPHDVDYAKLGIFTHVLGDRYSHHMCTDNSYFYLALSDYYETIYAPAACAQGNHFLWHVWEQGTDQSDENLDVMHQTMRSALEAVYEQLLSYAKHQGIILNQKISKKAVVDNLIVVLEDSDPERRLDKMVKLMEKNKLLPLPGHGHVTELTLDAWLKRAGA